MILHEDQLETVLRQRRGSLGEIPFAVLLQALSSSRRSVVLEIERGALKKSILFENGVPVDCRSNLLQDTLSGFMVARGDLTEEVAQVCLDKSAARGLRFGEVMILEGLITASELYRVLQQNLAKKLLDGFSWRDGVFRIFDEIPEVDSSLKVSTPQLVVTGISRFALDEEVNKAVGPLVGKMLFLHPKPPHSLSEIRLSADQRRLTELLTQGRRIDELASTTSIEFSEIMRFLYSLVVLGIVVPQDQMPKALADSPAAGGAEVDEEPLVEAEEERLAPSISELDTQEFDAGLVSRALTPEQLEALRQGFPVKPQQVSVEETRVHEEGQGISEEERDAIMETYLEYRQQDAFDLLGVAETAAMTEIEDQFLEYARRFMPWRFAGEELADLAEKAQDIFLEGCRAFGELCDAERRNALIARRRTLREEQAKTPAPERFVIKSELLDPEVQFKKGKALMEAARYREARQQLEFAFDCDPQNSIYRAQLACCRFHELGRSEARKSLAELREVLRIDPECGLAYYFTGLIEGAVGETEVAESYLQRAIKMMMPDRRPIEALKALRAKQKKTSVF